jgi:hypothetical protein
MVEVWNSPRAPEMRWDCAAIALGRRHPTHPLGGELVSCACTSIPCVELERWLPIVRWLCGAELRRVSSR